MCLEIWIDSGVEEMRVLRNTKLNSVELVPLLQTLLVLLNLTARGGVVCYRFPNSLKHRKPNFLESIFICEKEKQKATLKI